MDSAFYQAAGQPHHSQPGTLSQQLQAVDIFLDDPTRHDDPEGAWTLARALVMDHARQFYVEMRAAGLHHEERGNSYRAINHDELQDFGGEGGE